MIVNDDYVCDISKYTSRKSAGSRDFGPKSQISGKSGISGPGGPRARARAPARAPPGGPGRPGPGLALGLGGGGSGIRGDPGARVCNPCPVFGGFSGCRGPFNKCIFRSGFGVFFARGGVAKFGGFRGFPGVRKTGGSGEFYKFHSPLNLV